MTQAKKKHPGFFSSPQYQEGARAGGRFNDFGPTLNPRKKPRKKPVQRPEVPYYGETPQVN